MIDTPPAQQRCKDPESIWFYGRPKKGWRSIGNKWFSMERLDLNHNEESAVLEFFFHDFIVHGDGVLVAFKNGLDICLNRFFKTRGICFNEFDASTF